MKTILDEDKSVTGSQDLPPRNPQMSPEFIYISTINPSRNKTTIDKLLSKDRRNTIATMVPSLSSIPINTYANLSWPGFFSLVFGGDASGATFYGGFPANILSDQLFKTKAISDDMVRELNQIAFNLKKNKALGHQVSSDFWGDITQASMAEKIIEISERKKVATTDRKSIVSSTKYYKKQDGPLGNPQAIISNKHAYPVEIEQTHNECHIKATLLHLKSITITKEDFESRDVGMISSNNAILINSKHVTKLITKKAQQEISEARKKISEAEDDEGKRELEYFVDVEISKSTVILQKFALLHEKIIDHQDRKIIESNEMMRIAFDVKEKKDPTFSREEKNQTIWIEAQINYLKDELDKLHKEIKDLKVLYGFEITATESLENVIQKMTEIAHSKKTLAEIKKDFKKEIDDWKEKVQTNEVLRQSIKDKIIPELKRDIPITIYDKSESSITVAQDLEVSLDDLKKDPLVIYQLVTNNLGEKINELYPNEEERKSAIIACNESSIEKGLNPLIAVALIFNNIEIVKILLEKKGGVS